jgi:integrase
LLNSIQGERLEAFFVLALTTGLRRGELLALRWEDVDLGSRQLRVRQALQRADGKLRIVESKTTTSRRTVVLPKLAIRHLFLDAMKKRASASGGCWKLQASVSTRQGGPYE